jgi:signal transduction histidine kinase
MIDETIANPDLASKEIEKTRPAAGWMRLARAGWVFWAIVAWGSLILSVRAQISTFAAQGNLVAQSEVLLVANLVARTAAALISLALAGVLYIKRPNEGLALLTAYFLLANGMVVTPLLFLEPYWPGAQSLSYAVIQPLFFAPLLVAFLSVFPNGRFTPAWTRWLVIAAILYGPVGTLLLTSRTLSRPTAVFILAVLTWFALIFAGLYAQIHRFRRVSNAVERQQTKWFLFGFSMEAVLVLLITILTVGANYFSLDLSQRWWAPLINLGWALVFATLPVSLTFAVMRYRLFDIDLIINRTLVYGALTASIVGLYVLVVGALGIFFQTQGNLLIALLATGIVAVLFQPLRDRLQRGANRLIYGERDDPVEALSRLGRRLETAVPPDEVLSVLVETIALTLKLPYVAIHLTVEQEDRIAAAYGNPTPDLIQFPLVYQGEKIGQLVVGPRSPGSAFSPEELRLLRNIARQAGSAIQAVRLTGDLQRSRQQLITAREEERRRLRRDLHDGLGATLAALNLEAAVLRRSIRTDPQRAESLVDEFRQDIRAAIDDIRHLVYALRPPTLDQLGLVEAVRAQAVQYSRAEVQNEAALQITVEAPETLPPLPAAVEVAAFRIIQEALTNVVTHAQARHCVVRLELGHDLQVEVVDDGVGLGNGRPPPNGLGLLSMRERAEELGGTCLIEPAAGGGTRIVAALPLLEA